MSFSRAGDGLSERLRLLKSFYQLEHSVWDIGCDHGLLGLSFAGEESVGKLHLVDPSLPVIDVLKKKLKDSYISIPEKIVIHHQRGQEIIPDPESNCIFIAGMGGKEIESILKSILPRLKEKTRLILSPHRNIIELRKFLSEQNVSLETEVCLNEDNQFYQIIVIRVGQGTKVSLYGEALWKTPAGEQYRDHMIRHFSSHRDEASQGLVQYLMNLKVAK